MKYKRFSKPKYVPLFRFVREAPLPEKAKQLLKDADFVTKIKCDVCHENSLQIYRVYRVTPKGKSPEGYIVCVNPKCATYAEVYPF